MAYVSKEKKAKIAAELKKVMPKDWKYSLRVDNHNQICLTVRSAPIPEKDVVPNAERPAGKLYLNHFYPEMTFQGSTLKIVEKAISALNTDNFDHSDIQTDYFHVGHYVEMSFGLWNKPFVNTI